MLIFYAKINLFIDLSLIYSLSLFAFHIHQNNYILWIWNALQCENLFISNLTGSLHTYYD